MNLEMASFVLLKFSSARAVAATSVASLNRPRFRLQLFAKIVPAKLADGLFVPMIRIKEFHSCHPAPMHLRLQRQWTPARDGPSSPLPTW